MRARTWLAAAGTAGLVLLPAAAAPVSAAAPGDPVRLLAGATPATTLFPSDEFTVADPAQATGLRVDLPQPDCAPGERSLCDDVALLNELDGFDVGPRVVLPFSGPVQLDSVNSTTVHLEGPDGRVGLHQLVQDPETHTVAGYPVSLLRERTEYRLVVTDEVLDAEGYPVEGARSTTFTTMSATSELDRMRAALDDGSAYEAAGIADREISFEFSGPPQPVTRRDQTSADPADPREESVVPVTSLVNVGTFAFGSFVTPRYARKDGGGAVIPQVPTGSTPQPLGAERIGVVLLLPATPPPPGGYPTVVYGPGFTRSDFDLFVSADFNAARGLATIATNPVGHGFGPASTAAVGLPETEFPTFGRGEDVDGDGTINADEGVQPLARNGETSPEALVGLRDGLKQTVVDQMALIRAVQRGVDVDGDGTDDLATTGTNYFGLSFGGIYGTMLMGTDPRPELGMLNVPGGPIADIARLSGFRDRFARQLDENEPSLLNGGPGLEGFTESLPVPSGELGSERVTEPASGSLPLQEYLGRGLWLQRSGGPEVYAPLLRLRPREGAPEKTVLYQIAFGDNTVPNPTSGILVRAGELADRVTYYRNDRTPTRDSNPHGFLADPTIFGRQQAQLQASQFLASGGDIVDPDGPATVFEVPIADPRNLTCLHYPDPQTGVGAFPPPAEGECPPEGEEPRGTPAATLGGGPGNSAPGGGATAAPAGNGGSETRGSTLPRTGGPALGLAALALTATALGLHRRRGSTAG